jgi:hypothetical protein
LGRGYLAIDHIAIGDRLERDLAMKRDSARRMSTHIDVAHLDETARQSAAAWRKPSRAAASARKGCGAVPPATVSSTGEPAIASEGLSVNAVAMDMTARDGTGANQPDPTGPHRPMVQAGDREAGRSGGPSR